MEMEIVQIIMSDEFFEVEKQVTNFFSFTINNYLRRGGNNYPLSIIHYQLSIINY